jgi:hypothetical protein
LARNRIPESSPLISLRSLTQLELSGNQIAEIAALDEMAFKDMEGDRRFTPCCSVDLSENPAQRLSRPNTSGGCENTRPELWSIYGNGNRSGPRAHPWARGPSFGRPWAG